MDYLERRNVNGTTASVIFNLGTLPGSDNTEVTIRAVATNLGGIESDDHLERVYNLRREGPEAVQNVTAEPASTSVLLRWQYEPCDYFAGFVVEVSEQANGTFRRIGTVWNTLGFNAVNLTHNTTYWFRVSAFDSFDNFSPFSEIQATTTADILPPVVTSIWPSPGLFSHTIPSGNRNGQRSRS